MAHLAGRDQASIFQCATQAGGREHAAAELLWVEFYETLLRREAWDGQIDNFSIGEGGSTDWEVGGIRTEFNDVGFTPDR